VDSSASPLLTVVVPAYQVAQYLPRCLDSIVAQPPAPAADLEVIVIDDHCPDRSGEIADRYARRDPRVRTLHLTSNVGLGRARNLGIAHARGTYLWFVDGDDWLPAGTVPAVLTRLAATRPDVLVVNHATVTVGGRARASTPAGTLASDGAPRPLSERPELLLLDHSACTKLVRRGFLDEIGLRFHPGWYEDSSYSHPLLLAAARIDTLDRVCYCYRQRPGGGITRSVSARHFDVFAQYERMWSAAARSPAAYHRFRPQLFRLMVNHLLVIAGNEQRVPPSLRRDFFRRLHREYRRRLPAGGYPRPGGLTGLKHRLVHWNAYELYAALRLARRADDWLRARSSATTSDRGARATRSATGDPHRPVDLGDVRQREAVATR
jgi:CDP-glycerol glycerophosphotransferase